MHTLTPHTFLYSHAVNFLQQHENEHLTPDRDRLITRCAHHLVDHGQGATSLAEAKDVARQAFGELTSDHCHAYINLDLTTSYALFINESDGAKRCYPLSELLRVIRQAEAGAL
jgi:hypothetical protein